MRARGEGWEGEMGIGTPAQQELGKKFFGPFFNWPDDTKLREWLCKQDPDELEQFLNWFDFSSRRDRETLGRQELRKLRSPTEGLGSKGFARGEQGTKSMEQASHPALLIKREDSASSDGLPRQTRSSPAASHPGKI